MEPRINFVTLITPDLPRAREFYCRGLGWPPAFEADEVVMIHVGTKLVLSLWDARAAVGEIGQVGSPESMPMVLAHNVSSPAEVDAVLAAAETSGATVTAGVERDWGGYSGYFTDPVGFRWEVAHNPYPVGEVTLP